MDLHKIRSKLPWLTPLRTILIIVGTILLSIPVFSFWKDLGRLFFVGIFIILGSLSYFYRRQIELRIGIEFIFPFTVLSTLAYGVGTALFVGNFSTFLSEIVGGRIDERIIMNFVSITVTAFVATPIYAMTGNNLFLTGILSNLCYHGSFLLGLLVFAGNPMKTLVFIATNMLWQLMFFLRIAPFIFSIMPKTI